ncbi:MAG: 16S rRNA (cytosine(967)-C(5))-methyltransferase RsmB [Clostridia bacterium]
MNKNPRSAALQALLQVSENEGYSNIVIDKVIRSLDMDKRDTALASQIFYGVLEKRITLDFYIGKYLNNPFNKLDPVVKEILRLSFYQALFLDKIPNSAIVNEAVELTKEYKKPKLSGFVNAVLREFFRNEDYVILPKENTLYGLSVKYSVPTDLIDLWQMSYGQDNTIKILESFNEKAKIYIRKNTVKNIDLQEVNNYPYLENAYQYSLGGSITKIEGFDEGAFHVQDLASQYLCKILNPQENENIIDVCAAPGGKTFTLSQLMNNTGKVYSYDLYKGRVKLIRAGAYRLGLTNVLASVRDATSPKCEIENADRILCDVPCSGFGTIRRKPEIRYKDPETFDDLPNIQYDILCKSAKHLKQGGVLMYSTCTLNPFENGKVADRFLREHKDFEALEITIPNGLKKTILEPDNQLTMMPFAGDTDGFFVAMFKKL